MATDRQKLINAARRILHSRADAEDVVQDAYVRAFSTFSDWRTLEPAWMYTVLRNLAVDRYRRLQTELRHADGGLTVASASDCPEVRSEREAAIRHLLNRVSGLEAATILLRDVFEFEYHEIAEILGRGEPATRQLLHRARQRARKNEAHNEVDAASFALFCRAIETREPALLMDMLHGITARARIGPPSLEKHAGARSASVLVQINGRYAIALVLDGIILCVVPVGVQAMRSDETV
jgi:RNA polymerase sigma-70 factor (ECF subfamily)